MGDKTLKWFLGGILLVIVFVIIMTLVHKNDKEEYFNVVDIPKTHNIYNKTDKKYLDTIVSAGLSVIGIEPSVVILEQLKKKISFESEDGEIVLHAFIKMAPSPFGNQYIIYLADLPKKEYIGVLSHELIHLIQYETGHLQMYDDYMIWHGNIIYDDNIPDYRDREWEQDARGLSPILANEIKEILIPKKDDR